MEAGLKFFLKLSDGTCSKLVDDPQELIDACEESGRLGDIYATYVAPQLYARMKGVLHFAESETVRPPQDAEPSPIQPEAPRPSGAMPEKTRRAKRIARTNKANGSGRIFPVESPPSES